MKMIYSLTLPIVTAGLWLAGLSSLLAQDETAVMIGILPEQKSPTVVTDTERNPFALRQDKKEVGAVFDKESEESKIRRIFSNLKVSGVSRGKDGRLRVLIGDMILEKGKPVPQLIPSQTDRIIVSDVTDEQVELAWLEKRTSRYDGRKLLIAIELQPAVEFVLAGQDGRDELRAVQPYADSASSGEGVVSYPFGGGPENEEK